MNEPDHVRFRSFAERYIIERASKFEGDEAAIQKQAWDAALTARTIYKQIKQVSTAIREEDERAEREAQGRMAGSVQAAPMQPPPKSAIDAIRDALARGDKPLAEQIARTVGLLDPAAKVPPPNSTPAGQELLRREQSKYKRMREAMKW